MALTFTGDLDLTERGGRLQVASSMRLASDLTPIEFTVKGKSYRFVNVDAAVKVAGGMATVTNLGETKTFEAPRRFFTAQSYAPLSARALLIRYWERNGKPATLPVMPGEPTREVRIEQRGTDTIVVNGRKIALRRFSIDGIVWGTRDGLDRRGQSLRGDRVAHPHPAARRRSRGSEGRAAGAPGSRRSRIAWPIWRSS